jgi:aminocarboxymuconate-semialdehyde decarboxylase
MIDLHAHHWPAAMLEALGRGHDWFGWECVRTRDGVSLVSLGGRLVRFPLPDVDLADLDRRLARRAVESIEAEAVMPVGFLWGEHLGADAAAAMCEAVNEELADIQRTHPATHRGIGLLPFHAPQVFSTSLARAVESGLDAFAVPTNVQGRGLDDARVLPLLEQLLEADVVLVLHPTYLDGIGQDRLPRYYFANTFGAPMESAVAVLTLIHSGILDRNPDARILALNGGGCAPYEIGRFARRYETRNDTRTMQRPPQDYLSIFHYDSLVLDELSLRLLIDRVGTDRVVVGTDHPFRTDVEGGSVALLRSLDWLADDAREAILRTNAERLLRHRFAIPSGEDHQS